MRFGGNGPGPSTLYQINDVEEAGISYPLNSNPAGCTQVSPALVSGQKTLVIPVVGQSLAACFNGSTAYTVTQLTQMLSIADGNVYTYKDPALGTTGPAFSWMGRCGDNLIAAGKCARVIWVPIAIGGAPSAWWATGGYYSRIQVAANRCRALGYRISCWVWQQGQADNTAGTTSEQYQANVIKVQNIMKGSGFDVPMLISQNDTLIEGTTSSAVAAGQAALVDNSQNRFAGPNVDALTVAGGYRLGDSTHLSDTGLAAIAGTGTSGWQTAIEALIDDGVIA